MAWIDEVLSGIPANAVLRERLLLASEQRAALQSEVTALNSENEVLKLDNRNLRQEIQRRDDVIQKEKSHSNRLDEVKEKILVLLASQNAYESNVVQSLGVGAQVAAFHLQELESTYFIGRSLSMMGQELPWHLNQEGRRYLITHGLIT